jgi:molybdate transport system permease protein
MQPFTPIAARVQSAVSRVLALTPEEVTAIELSLRVAIVATAVSLPIGVLIALVLARGRFVGRGLLNALVLVPLVLPPVVTGYLLLLAFGRNGPLGSWLAEHLGIVFAFRWTGAALACALMGFPLMVRAIRLSIEAVDRKLEQAGATLGASPFWVFATVTLPLIVPGLLAGAILAFARSMGEFGATITFVSNIPGETQTLPTLIYTFTQVPGGEPAVLRLTVISLVISLVAVLASEAIAERVHRRLNEQ